MRIFVSSNSTNLFQAPPHTQVNQGSSFGLAPLHAPPHFPPTHHNPPPFPYIAFPPSPPGGWHEKAMKVTQQFSTSCWDYETPTAPSSVFCCKRLRPLAPKLSIPDGTRPALDLRSFIKPESNLRNAGSGDERREPLQVEAQSGGTRWNPTQEQIGILEMLYKGGMRTPNAQQIEHITVQLGKYGKIEGKNVFYWFQNHKARERQKQKRNNHSLGTPPSCRGNNNKNPPQSPSTAAAGPGAVTDSTKCEAEKQEDSSFKRKWRSWGVHSMEVECRVHVSTCEDMTLELFPLHPESR